MIQTSDNHQSSLCCSQDLNDDELEIIDSSIKEENYLPSEEMATLYYVCGYIAYKEQRFINQTDSDVIPESEFLRELSRGRLSHPLPGLVAFAKSCFYIFSTVKSDTTRFKSNCAKRFSRMFVCLGEAFPFDFCEKLLSVCVRLANIFCKGFIRAFNESVLAPLSSNSAASERKIRKLNWYVLIIHFFIVWRLWWPERGQFLTKVYVKFEFPLQIWL